MQFALRIISYFFHPLLTPITGTILYFALAPYSPIEEQSGTILPIFILTVLIPIIFFFILKNLKLISISSTLSITERKYPILISCGLLVLILYKIIPLHHISEIYYFFVGLLTSVIALFILLFLKLKVSLYLTGLGNTLLFLIGLSIHFEVNITIAISALILFSGLVTSSRLYQKAHSFPELLLGFIIGACSQLFLFKFWL